MNGFKIMEARNTLLRDNMERLLLGKRVFINDAVSNEMALSDGGAYEIIKVGVELYHNKVNLTAKFLDSETYIRGTLRYSDMKEIFKQAEPTIEVN